MTYTIVIEKRAKKFIDSQPTNQQTRILNAIHKLPIEGDIKALVGHSGVFRLRVGGYRIIFTKQDDALQVVVIDAGNRGQVYGNL